MKTKSLTTRPIRTRSFWQIEESKHIYRKHLLRYKAKGYPVKYAARYQLYARLLAEAIVTSEKGAS